MRRSWYCRFVLMIQPYITQVCFAELFGDVIHNRFGLLRHTEIEGHGSCNIIKVDGFKAALGDADDAELGRRWSVFNEGVDTVEVSLHGFIHRCAFMLFETCSRYFGVFLHPQREEDAVDFNHGLTDYLGQRSTACAAHHFHLKQSLLRMRITKSHEQVVVVLRLDVRDTEIIEVNGYRLLKAAYGQRTFIGRRGRLQP